MNTPPATPQESSAQEAWRRARPGDRVIGWLVDERAREGLLERFAPKYARTVAHHVTLKPRVHERSALPGEVRARIVGRADDGEGVEAMVVEIDGTLARPDGGTFHITWSLGESRKARESNDVIRTKGWSLFDTPVDVPLHPAVFR